MPNKHIAVATIFDNTENMGAMLQGHCLLVMLGGHGIYFNRFNAADSLKTIEKFRNQLNLSPPLTQHAETAAYINDHCDVLVVGSDEIWKLENSMHASNPYLFPFPNHLFGCDIDVPKIALAATCGSQPFHVQPANIQQQIQKSLARFDMIYVRDNVTAGELERLEVNHRGFLPDPTFAFNFMAPPVAIDPNRCYDLVKGVIDTQALDPISWFAAHAQMSSAVVYRMHSLIACLRGNTPCLIRDRRSKTKELAQRFGLPESCWGDSIQRVKEQWRYDEISRISEDYQRRWANLLTELDERYRLHERSHNAARWRPGSTLSASEYQ